MSESSPRTERFDVEVQATPEEVWRAITDAAELTRWFPLEARVKPGLGGSIFLSWGEAAVTAWEPLRRVGWTEQHGTGASAVPVSVEFLLDALDGGRTRVRVVHSGMGHGETWDAYVDSITRGWKFELGGLRHYLEHHRGAARHVVWVRQPTKLPAQEVASRVLGSNGQVLRGALESAGPGDALDVRSPGAPAEEPFAHLRGQVCINGLPRSFAATVANLGNSYLRFEFESMGGGTEAWLWLSTYGLPAQLTTKLERYWRDALARALA